MIFTMYAAMNPDGIVHLFKKKPQRYKCENIEYWVDYSIVDSKLIPPRISYEMFPDLTWESEPIEVEITMKRK